MILWKKKNADQARKEELFLKEGWSVIPNTMVLSADAYLTGGAASIEDKYFNLFIRFVALIFLVLNAA